MLTLTWTLIIFGVAVLVVLEGIKAARSLPE
jgi:hypothetical protein